MPLHSIEIVNFKSYKGNGPFKNFTAVIGPNGAGKSNLMDAQVICPCASNPLRRYLHFYICQLRSTQLRDLIYKGGDREDEDQAPKKAAVTAIYIDHKTGDQHRFSRTITVSSEKSGSSAYSINGNVVRWEEYQSTLEQYDILVKAKNFLVFQGDVEAVASQNPNALSKLIDQISGSLDLAAEYEKRRLAHLEASKQSNDQLIKRRVINGEIKDFKQQKAEMEEFRSLISLLSENQDQEIVHLLLWKLFHIEASIEEHSEAIKLQNNGLAALQAESADLDQHVAQARKEYTQATRDVIKAERSLKSKEKEKEDSYLPKLMECEARVKHLEKRKTKEETSKVSAQTELLAKKQALSPAMTLSEEDQKEYHTIKADCLTKCPREREDVKNLARKLKNQENQLLQHEDHLQQCQNRHKKLDHDYEDAFNKKTMLENKVDTLNQELTRTRKQLHEVQAERTRHAQTETELKEKLQDCLKQLNEAGAAKQETDAEARNRAIGENIETQLGVQGRVYELCSPIARKHETAVRVVLGRNLEAVVVDTEKTAIDCVEYLKSQRLGRATFIPLDSIVVQPVDERSRNLSKGARLAIDLIKYEPIYERAMQYACGSAIICDSFQIAQDVVYNKNTQVKAVTLEGTIIHKGGNITGGVSGLDNSRKFDEREIQALKRAREVILSEIKEAAKNQPRNTDEGLIAEVSRLENELTFVKDDLRILDDQLKAYMEELKVLAKRQDTSQADVDKGRSDVEKSKAELEKAKAVIDKTEDKIFASFCRRIGVQNIREYEGYQLEVHQKTSEEQEQLETTLSRIKHQISFETGQLNGLVERLSTLETSAQRTQANLEELMVTMSELKQEITILDDEIVDTGRQHSDLLKAQDQASKAVADAKKKSNKASRQLDEIIKEIGTRNDEIEKLASERISIYRRCKLESIDLPLSKGDLRRAPIDEVVRPIETQQALVVDDYGIEVDYEGLEDDEKEDGGQDVERQLEEKLERLKSKMEAMAPKTRSEARLREHEKEFEAARKRAKQTKDDFTEIKNQRVELFTKAYTHISEKIDGVYKELTKGKASPMGGVAYLSLEDPEEPYMHGIKYHAMPPMKRFRDMDQLSGGEKTMAALALLFAIHSYQPSPFFVLDEVDAALDNTNVGRIADYVRNKAESSFQFLVISLKGTFYEKAGGLVGIYRDNEWGGTKSLTLDLDQYGE
ncbi:RecF/RecN/SMC [Melampsora americana]|nr:RecF/RecN/SMC [Melampsora americana]